MFKCLFEVLIINGEADMIRLFARFLKDERGATAIEYGLIAGLIGVVIITALSSVGSNVSSQFAKIAGNLS